MAGFAARRLASCLLVLFLVTGLVFLVFYLLPSADPAAIRAGRLSSPEQVEQVRESLGLDRSVAEQYWIYMKGLITHLDLGYSYRYESPVSELVLEAIPPTLLLVAGAAVLWLGLGVPGGVAAATRRGSPYDRGSNLLSLAFISAPLFWLGMFALYLFAVGAGELLPIFPGIGAYGDANTLPERLWALTLPWLVLGIPSAAIYLRYTRASMASALAEPEVTAATARGLSRRRVVWNHAARRGLVPIVTLVGLEVGALMAGNAVLVETVFNVPGVGRLLSSSIENADLPTIQGVVLVGAVFIVLLNLVVDLLYARLDPRLRYAG